MALIDLQGTSFSFSFQLPKFSLRENRAKVEVAVKNEWVSYKQIEKHISPDRIEEWIFCMFRLLAGAYKREYNLSFEEAGLAFDFYPYTKDGNEVSREERRKGDCVMAIRMLMRSSNGKFLNGVYTLLLHRAEIEEFAKSLRKEYDKTFVKRVHGKGEYLFVGVSPLGYEGCNYWYFDPSGETKQGDYIWVEMGSHNTKQIVLVDSVRWFTEEDAPYPVDTVKEVLAIASEEEFKTHRKDEK